MKDWNWKSLAKTEHKRKINIKYVSSVICLCLFVCIVISGCNAVDGVEYMFYSPEAFRQLVRDDKFVEYEEVYQGRFYGTLKSEVNRIWHSGQTVEERDDGSVYVRFQTTQKQEVVRWVLGQGHTVRVLAPQSLADEVRAEALRTAALYATACPAAL